MTPVDALWHLVNLFALPSLLGMIAAALAKAAWRERLRAAHWRTLAVAAMLAASAVQLISLVVFGAEGRMASYAAMVAAVAVAIAWAARRRRAAA